MVERGLTRADMVEGYEDYLHGIKREDCPYPDDVSESSSLREGWLMGWDKANQEDC